MTLQRITACGLALVVLAGVLAGAAPPPAAAQAGGVTTRVSVSSDGTQGDSASWYSSISADGRYVAFASDATNLVPGDTNSVGDVFVHDRQTGQTSRVSVSSDGTQQSDDWRDFPSISADGRYIAFASDASNLTPVDIWYAPDVFVHDRQLRQTARVSVASDGTGGGPSTSPSISANGQHVAFGSWAGDLVPNDTNGERDIFVHDRQLGKTTRISISSDGIQGNNSSGEDSDSRRVSSSADGRYVAFSSSASNLVHGDTNGYPDIFVHDRQTGETARVSVASDGTQGNGWPGQPSISADGRYVAFSSSANNLVPGDKNDRQDVFVHDRQTGQTMRVSVSSDGKEGNGASEEPAISADGRYVAFMSAARNLVPGDSNGTWDVFVHDRQTGQTTRVSVAGDGAQANRYSSEPSISADGRYVAFCSEASNLVPGDTNDAGDVFVHDRGGGGSTWTVSGRVTDAAGQGISGVTLSAGVGGSATTDAQGYYALSLLAGEHVLRATKAGYSFIPQSLSITVSADVGGQDFRVEGVIADVTSAPIELRLPVDGLSGSTDRVTAWFDHESPLYRHVSNPAGIRMYTGYLYNTSRGDHVWGGLYGWDGYYYDGHDGIDFGRPDERHNPPILAAAGGTVTVECDLGTSTCGDMTCGYLGKRVRIDHGDGYATRYGHLNTVEVANGATVSAGQVIGTMGCTGNATGIHLHFAVLLDGKVMDPFGWQGSGPDPWGMPRWCLWQDCPQEHRYVDSSGGTMSVPGLSADIPPEAMSSATLISAGQGPMPAAGAGQRSVGLGYWLRQLWEWITGGALQQQYAQPAALAEPVTLTLAYASAAVRHLDVSALAVHRWDEGSSTWQPLPTTIDSVEQTATAQTIALGAFDLQAPLLCPGDVLEINDTYETASTLALGEPLASALDIADDEDWFRFEATAGLEYTIETTGLAAGVDTLLELYDRDGLSLLATDDDGGEAASRIEWQAPASGVYYARVTGASESAYGCDAAYTLRVAGPQPQGWRLQLPLVLR
jgi:murein DD-endopeptidase MepM/ murein hydrolase activator NlpD